MPLLASSLGLYGMFDHVSRYAAFPNIPYTPSDNTKSGENRVIPTKKRKITRFVPIFAV